jgi:hypothetical protein
MGTVAEQAGGRTIFVGDIHGCADELSDLLDRVALGSDDRVISVGDLVTRGPKGHQVLELCRKLGVRAVLGNHELKLLGARRARLRGEPGPRLGPSHERALAELTAADWALIEALPLYLDLAPHGTRVVHAGVVPGRDISDHDARLLTHLRTIDEHGQPSEGWNGRLWGELYTGPPHVVFGHNARQNVQLHAWATGLDTGCVYGGALTALVLQSGQSPPPAEGRMDVLVSVKARHTYYHPTHAT